jgi:hypothetical protein
MAAERRRKRRQPIGARENVAPALIESGLLA